MLLRQVRTSITAGCQSRLFSAISKRDVRDLVSQLGNLKGKRVLLRTDFNVPLDKKNTSIIADDTRIRAALPTLKVLIDNGARIFIATHMGRPKGEPVSSLRLDPVAARLSELLSGHSASPVLKLDDCIGPLVEEAAAGVMDGQVVLLENVRFHAEETKNDPAFAAALQRSTGAEIYVNDAFGTAHRAHASTEGVAKCAGISHAVAGLLMRKELEFLSAAVDVPTRPLVAITGGAKVSTKLPVLSALLPKVDALILGGGMIFTFYRALGYRIGDSLVEEDMIPMAAALLEEAKAEGTKLLLPTDIVIADSFDEAAATNMVTAAEGIPDGWLGMDIGPDSVRSFEQALADARTVVWNGPMGVFEMEPFRAGTVAIARALAKRTDQGATTIIGGGDSVSAVEMCGLSSRMTHISTGGGASLELLEGKTLPGIAALDDK